MARTPQPLSPNRDASLTRVAAETFLRGYDAASLNQIIRDAGMAKSSFYHYFANKRALHDHVVTSLIARVGKYLQLPTAESLTAETFWPSLYRLSTQLGEAATAHPETMLLARLFHQPQASPGGECALERFRSELRLQAGRLIGRGQDLGVVRDDLPTDLVTELAIGLALAVDRWVSCRDPLDDGTAAAVETALDAIVTLLGGLDECRRFYAGHLQPGRNHPDD